MSISTGLFVFRHALAWFLQGDVMSLRTGKWLLVMLLWHAAAAAWAQATDEQGYPIATQREIEMMERGYLFYPPRAIRKPPQAQAAPTPTPTPPVTAEVHTAPELKPPEQAIPVVPTPAPASELASLSMAGEKILQTHGHNRLASLPRFEKSAMYVGGGSSVVVGKTTPLPDGRKYRIEFSDGFMSVGGEKTLGGGQYNSSVTRQRLGLFLDWSPNQDHWYVTGGLTLNQHTLKLRAKPNSTVVIHGKSIEVGNGVLDIDYSLPKLTPYVGVRYVRKPYHDKGWEGFAEVGVVLAKLNADVTTSLIGQNGLTESDVLAETDALRKSMYRWSVVPHAVVGMSYKY